MQVVDLNATYFFSFYINKIFSSCQVDVSFYSTMYHSATFFLIVNILKI